VRSENCSLVTSLFSFLISVSLCLCGEQFRLGIPFSKSCTTQSRCIFYYFSHSARIVSLRPCGCNDQGLTTTMRAATAKKRSAGLRARLGTHGRDARATLLSAPLPSFGPSKS
jgi:hypothetical protein